MSFPASPFLKWVWHCLESHSLLLIRNPNSFVALNFGFFQPAYRESRLGKCQDCSPPNRTSQWLANRLLETVVVDDLGGDGHWSRYQNHRNLAHFCYFTAWFWHLRSG